MQLPPPQTHDVVLVGGGHTHALILREWSKSPRASVRLTLINPSVNAPYTGMLPGFVAGHYSRQELDIDLVRLCRSAGARLVVDRAIGLDRAQKRIHLAARPPIRYDLLSLDIGVTADLPSIPGFFEYGHSVKPLDQFALAWAEYVNSAGGGDAQKDCLVIGGGVAGVETALAMARRLKGTGSDHARITIVEVGDRILSGVSRHAQSQLQKRLGAFGIDTLVGAQVAEIAENGVTLADGRKIAARFVLSTVGARPHTWVRETDLALTAGFINVLPTLQTVSDPSIFAAGDCAHLCHDPRPKAGVFAVRQAPVLYSNLCAVLDGRPLAKYRPQRRYLKIISSGEKIATAEKFGLSLTSRRLWRWKDRIDRKFMGQFNDLPTMSGGEQRISEEAFQDDGMLCGGCGAKVPIASLRSGLALTAKPHRTDVALGAGDDAAVLRIGGREQVIAVDHLRSFTDDPWMLARIATVHALGDVWAMGAAPQSGLLSLVLPRMSEDMQTATIAEMSKAAENVLVDAGADLVGGHTSLGAEMLVGLTVTGLVQDRLITLKGAKAGDALILTKPIGTGVILAGEMLSIARGSDVRAALDSMSRPQGHASAILAEVANAMTDVTGFGLAGHLMSMLERSGLSAEISLDKVPILQGAEVLSDAGVRSSLWAANSVFGDRMTSDVSVKRDLLFDPQTAGGLLAAVPETDTSRVLDALRDMGETPTLIGFLRVGEPWIYF